MAGNQPSDPIDDVAPLSPTNISDAYKAGLETINQLKRQRDTAVAIATSRLLDFEECRRQLAEAIKDRDNSLKIANMSHAQWERADSALKGAEWGRDRVLAVIDKAIINLPPEYRTHDLGLLREFVFHSKLAEARAEKAERERDAAVAALRASEPYAYLCTSLQFSTEIVYERAFAEERAARPERWTVTPMYLGNPLSSRAALASNSGDAQSQEQTS